MFFKSLATAALISIASVPAASAAVIDFVNNGGFENGDFSGWTLTPAVGGNSAPVVIQYGATGSYPTNAFGEVVNAPPSGGGSYGAYFSTDRGTDILTQNLGSLTLGTIYTFSFDYYFPGNGLQNPANANYGLSVVATFNSLGVSGSTSPPGQQWNHYSRDFTYGGPTTLTVSFTGNGNPAADIVLDNISLTAAVPEPSTWAMLFLGFAGVAGMAYRRRKHSVSALTTA